jgi:uncharacterized membrane protein
MFLRGAVLLRLITGITVTVHLFIFFLALSSHLRRIWIFFDDLLIQSSPYLLRCCQIREISAPPRLSMVGLDPTTHILHQLRFMGHPLKTDDGENLDADMILVLDRGWGVV